MHLMRAIGPQYGQPHGLRRSLLAAMGALLCLLLSAPLRAVDITPRLPDPVMQQRYDALIHELRCMQCQNEALADSNVSLAADLRLQVRDLVAAGKSDDEVRDYLVARYGEFILFRPRMSLRNLWLWAAPAVLLIVGAAVALRVLRRRAALLATEASDDDAGAVPTSERDS
jgi:cytochrome c-type biogenesis protein CcmH